MTFILALIFSCGTGEQPDGVAPTGNGIQNLDQGQQHPPLPANNPAWEWDAGGFVSDFGWYGEQSWADVRMRVAGHISAAGRDLARLHSTNGDLKQAAVAYQDLVTRLQDIKTPESGVASQINTHLRQAAVRDHAIVTWLSGGPQPPPDDGLAALRIQYYALSMSPDDTALAALQQDLESHLRDRPDLALDAFSDFNSRHDLRVKLFDAYLDSLDPVGLNERWGYWQAEEIQRQAMLLGVAAGWLGGADWEGKAQNVLVGDMPDIPMNAPAWQWPSILAESLHSPDQQPHFSVDGLGWLPTGDSLIDVAGSPGPIAIGSLMKMGLEDDTHRIWLEETRDSLQPLLAENPTTLLEAARERAAHLDGFSHGSRFYNVKQLRNEVVRQLAIAGHFHAASDMLSDNFPLHNQDWACPNRAGILHAISGRLLANAGQDTAGQTLHQSLTDASIFLDNINTAEQNPGKGKRPPGMRPGNGPENGPPNGPPGNPNGPGGPPPNPAQPDNPPGTRGN